MELLMSATTYNTFAETGYFANIATAARQLFAAVFAVQPVVSQRNTEETIWWLNSLAKDCELTRLACPPNCATSPRAVNRITFLENTMLTIIENLPAAIALSGLVLRLYLGGKPENKAE
jgi:hypothetical protein